MAWVRTMPFGQYEGWALTEVPSDYLSWCLRNLTRLGAGLRGEMEDELRRRQTPPPPSPPPPPRPPPAASGAILDAVERVFRAAILKHHPDRGGSSEAIRVVMDLRNEIARVVREQIGS